MSITARTMLISGARETARRLSRSRAALIILAVIFYALLATPPAVADVFDPVSGRDTKVSLNGKWKFSREDWREYSNPDYDDSAWPEIDVPGAWNRQGYKGIRVGWYRKKFNAAKDSRLAWLSIGQALDEAEVWLNGEKLINPGFQPPLEDRQKGVYAEIWTFRWPETFHAGPWIKDGGENVIAVRVTDNPIRRSKKVAVHEEPTFSGTAGITGGVTLAGYPRTYIRAFERIPSVKAGRNTSVEHVFRAVLGVADIKSRKCRVQLTILDGGGAKKFEKTLHTVAGENGRIVEFKWTAKPAYDKYTAELSLQDEEGVADRVSLSFHGVLVAAGGNSLTVNGKPYVIKGVEGLPGLVEASNIVKSPTLKTAWIRADLLTLRSMGVNTLRIEEPPVSVVIAARDLGIMVVPVIRRNWDETALALREFRNILYWDLAAENAGDLIRAAAAISSLDVYKRPIAYSGTAELDQKYGIQKYISIRGLLAPTTGSVYCGAPEIETRLGLPVVIIDWGQGIVSGDDYDPVRAEPVLRSTWKECAQSNKVRGVFYSNLGEIDSRMPPIRDPRSRTWNRFLPELLGNLFLDFKLKIIKDAAGRQAFEISYHGATPVENIRITQKGQSKPVTVTRNSMLNGQFLQLRPAAGIEKITEVAIEYETGGGISGRQTIKISDPVFSPEKVTFRVISQPFSAGRENSVRLTLVGGRQPQTAKVSLESDDPDTTISPGSRSVSVPPGGQVEVPFAVVPGKNKPTILITALIQPTVPPDITMKAYMPVDVK